MEKICNNCDYGSKSELNDIICTNGDSAYCCEFMGENNTCEHWQGQGTKFWDKFWSEDAERERKAKEYIHNIGLSMEQQ